MRVNQLVKELSSIFDNYVEYETNIKKKYSLNEKDIRFSYYRTSLQDKDSAIHLLMMSDQDTQDSNYLERAYKAYPIRDRFHVYGRSQKPTQEILFTITGQFIFGGYASSMYHLFENAFRINSQHYNSEKYDKEIKWIKKEFADIIEKHAFPCNKIIEIVYPKHFRKVLINETP